MFPFWQLSAVVRNLYNKLSYANRFHVAVRLFSNREVKHYVYGKRQTVDSCTSQKRENLRFSTFLTFVRTYSIFLTSFPGSLFQRLREAEKRDPGNELVNRQERSLTKSNFSVFWQKGNFTLTFAVCRKRRA